MSEAAISLKNISKCFKRYTRPVDRLQEILIPGKSRADEFWALRDINLEIEKGQTVGIVGRNGSGKSTLLQIIAGTLQPTTGEARVSGRISALLELGSGFNPEFTGRQNVFFNGRLLGLSQKEIEDKFDDIAAFADIGDFIDLPVKTYSSGMFVRLAFAVAVNVDPEVLIVDEALAVGDVVFQHRCMRRMRGLMDSGVSTLFVSHDSSAIKTLCNAAIMIHDGRIHTTGSPNAVVIEYIKTLTQLELGITKSELERESNVQKKNIESNERTVNTVLNSQSHEDFVQQQPKVHGNRTRRGNKKALIEDVKLLDRFGKSCGESPVLGFNEEVTLVTEIQVYEPLQECIVGFFICDKNGNEIIGSNTFEENIPISRLQPKDRITVKFTFKLPLRSGSYSVTVAGAENYTAVTFDWIDNAMVFQVLPPDTGKRIHALVDQPMTVDVKTSLICSSIG